MVERLRRGHRHYQHVIQEAIGGGTCEHRPGGCQEEECPFTMPAVVAAEAALEQGEFSEAADLFGAELDKGCQDCPRDGEYRKYPKWREATLRVLRARSLRRARLLHQAIATLDPVMHLCSPPPPRMATECQMLALRGRCLILYDHSQFYLREQRWHAQEQCACTCAEPCPACRARPALLPDVGPVSVRLDRGVWAGGGNAHVSSHGPVTAATVSRGTRRGGWRWAS